MADGERVSLEIHDRPSQTEDFGTAQPVIQRNRHDGIKRRPAKSRYNAFSFLCGKRNTARYGRRADGAISRTVRGLSG